jgi:cystathionine beta-lyase
MWLADMDFKCPQPVIDAVVEKAREGVYGYVKKTDAFFDAITTWVSRKYDYKIKKEWIVTMPGIVAGYTVAIQAFTAPGDGILVQMPVYSPFMEAIRNNDRKVVNNQLKNIGGYYEMDFDDLERKAARPDVKMMIFSSPHNPVGRVWKECELVRLADICARHDVMLVSDEVHADLIMKGHKHYAIAALCRNIAGRTLTAYSPSKTFNLAGFQTAFMVIEDPKIRLAFSKQVVRSRIGALFGFASAALIAAYTKSDAYLEGLLDYLGANLDYMEDFIAKRLPNLKMYRPEGTYLVGVDFAGAGLSGKALRDFMLNDAKIAVHFGEWFGTDDEVLDSFCRFNIACPRALLEEAMSRLQKALC